MNNDRTTNHTQPAPDAPDTTAPAYQCPDRPWCTHIAPGGEHADFHVSAETPLAHHHVDADGRITGWWCWLTEDRPDAQLIRPRTGVRLVLEGRPETPGGPKGVVEAEFDLSAASYLLDALDTEDARDALWSLVNAVAGRGAGAQP